MSKYVVKSQGVFIGSTYIRRGVFTPSEIGVEEKDVIKLMNTSDSIEVFKEGVHKDAPGDAFKTGEKDSEGKLKPAKKIEPKKAAKPKAKAKEAPAEEK